MIKEHDTVALTRDLPQDGLVEGDLGAVVHVYGDGKAFEVEFIALTGVTLAVLTLAADAVRAVTEREIAHVRQVASAAE